MLGFFSALAFQRNTFPRNRSVLEWQLVALKNRHGRYYGLIPYPGGVHPYIYGRWDPAFALLEWQ